MILGVVLATVAVLVLLGLGRVTKTPSASLDAFAQCLAAKKITMYGAYWCPHCQNEKKAFGTSFQFVPYVECTQETHKCLSLGIEGYPTWIFPDGRRLIGEQGTEKLSQASGCPLVGAPKPKAQ